MITIAIKTQEENFYKAALIKTDDNLIYIQSEDKEEIKEIVSRLESTEEKFLNRLIRKVLMNACTYESMGLTFKCLDE